MSQDIDSIIKDHMLKNGLPFDGDLLLDGHIHRWSSEGKQKDYPEWYVGSYCKDGSAYIFYYSWRWSERKAFYCHSGGNNESLSEEERQEQKRLIEEARRQDEELAAQGKVKAKQYWESLQGCTEHPYLQRKQVKAHQCRIDGETLVVPVYHSSTYELITVQRIWPDGTKRFFSGAKSGDACLLLGTTKKGKRIFVAEGFATGATAHEQLNEPVMIAFSCKNCPKVGVKLQTKGYRPCLLQDLGDAGEETAKQWKTLGLGEIFKPEFEGQTHLTSGDFNDLMVIDGKDAVIEQLKSKNYPSLDIGDFLTLSFPPPEFLIENLIPKGSVTFLYGGPGCGKSMLGYDCSVSMSTGTPLFFGWKTKKQRVAYIDAEMAAAIIHSRWSLALKRWAKFLPDGNVDLNLLPVRHMQQIGKMEDEINLYSEISRMRLDEVMEDNDVIFFDNFDKVATPLDTESGFKADEKDWRNVFLWMRKWCDQGKTIIVIGHTNKSGILRGTGKISDDADQLIFLRRMPQQLKSEQKRLGFLVKVEKSRIQTDASKTEVFGCEMLLPEETIHSNVKIPWLVFDKETMMIKTQVLLNKNAPAKEADIEKLD